MECPTELPWAEVGRLCEVRHTQWLVKVISRIRESSLNTIGFWRQLKQSGELGLPTAPPMINHEFAGDGLCHLRSKIVFDQGQAEVDAGCHPRRGPDRTVV